MNRKIELLSPAGDISAARAAFAHGAGAVYLGLKRFSARALAGNFSLEELERTVALARSLGDRKVYVTVNTLQSDSNLDAVAETLAEIEKTGVNGVIVQDLGVARICRENFPSLELHGSTQMAVHNLEGVMELKDRGFSRVVLARELSIADIRRIAERCGIELEVFIHGALCYSISGLCLFSALQYGRSGNKGLCAYCCRKEFETDGGIKTMPFSMRDLRLDGDLEALAAAGVASLKIEGRMKSATYVGAVTQYYRERLDGLEPTISASDLDTIFSRRTTTLYAHGAQSRDMVLDPVNRTHLGAKAGEVKRITKDREGRVWMRFHTLRALERHDGLQFISPGRERPAGFGIGAMRLAISRRNVFAAPAASDVEVELPPGEVRQFAKPGATVWCAHSEAVARRFAPPGASRAEIEFAGREIDIKVTLSQCEIAAEADGVQYRHAVPPPGLEKAQNPGNTPNAVTAAFSKLGGSGYRAGKIEVSDPGSLFAPASLLNAARRGLLARLDQEAASARIRAVSGAVQNIRRDAGRPPPARSLKIRLDQWDEFDKTGFDEIVVRVPPGAKFDDFAALPLGNTRLALPVWTLEESYPALRTLAKRLASAGRTKWEAGDIAGIRMLRQLGVEDLSCDWTCPAANSAAVEELAGMGVCWTVESPEAANAPPGQVRLAQCVAPLFISATEPAAGHRFRDGEMELETFPTDGLWITTDGKIRKKDVLPGENTRIDMSWAPPDRKI